MTTHQIDLEAYLLSKGLRVKRSGSQLYTTCVFCNEAPEKRGRLYLDDSSDETRGLHYCHLCNEKGNIHTLRRHFGDPPLDDGGAVSTDRSRRIYAAATDFYAEQLTDTMRSYLKTARGFTDETIAKFRFGWAERGSNLVRHLHSLGFDWDEIIATGLAKVREENKVEDFFGDVLTIPYLVAGAAVQIRGRKSGDLVDNKYLTPPGQLARLFNSDAAWGAEEIVICEGELDAISLTQLGFNAVGVPGAANWPDSWNGYFAGANRVFVLYDPDETGQRNTLKILEALGTKAKNAVLPVPEGMDPKRVDPNWYMANHGWGYAEFRNLFDDSIWANSLLISPRDAHREWSELQGVEGFKLGFENLDNLIKPGLLAGQVMVPLAKAEPVTNEIPTPLGFRKMGDLAVGDEVYGSKGHPTKVIGVYPQGPQECFEVTFSDRSRVTVSGDHLWSVLVNDRKNWETLTTKEILAHGLQSKRGKWRFRIPLTAPVRYPAQDLPVDPYTLGSIIANASMQYGSVELTTADPHIPERVAKTHIVKKRKVAEDACPRVGVNGIIGHIKAMGLDVRSEHKFIPDIYLQSSLDQRIALLQGLMDGDGCAERNKPHSVSYSTSSARLAEDVATLVSSLGGTAAVNAADRERIIEYRVSIMLPSNINPFSTPLKLDVKRPADKKRTPLRKIIDIQPAGRLECQCIAVIATDNLYLTSRRHLVTHNTNSGKSLMLLNIFQRASMVKGQENAKILFVSLEQTRGDWFERARRLWNFYNQDADPEEVNQRTIDYWEPRLRLVDKNRITPDEFFTVLREYEEQMGSRPDLVAVDYLGYWAQAFPGHDRYQKVTDAVMKLKEIAKDQRVAILAPHQVNRSAEFGEEFAIDQGRDSGAIEETADFMLSMWNPDTLKSATGERKGNLHLSIGKSRHGGKGQTFMLKFGYMTLTIAPADSPEARLLSNEADWSLDARLDWTHAIRAHVTGTDAWTCAGVRRPGLGS